MPYYITSESEECAGWAVVTSDMAVVGCHLMKQDAIDQMVAVSQSEGIEPGGKLVELEDAEDYLSEEYLADKMDEPSDVNIQENTQERIANR